MRTSEPGSFYHDRVDISEYDEAYSDIPERELNHHDVTSPFDAWSVVKLRGKLTKQKIAKVQTDLLIWGRGEPKHSAGTKIGGVPAWPVGKPLPCAKEKLNLFTPRLRFFGQFNFMDSLDLIPELPGGLLSVWGTPDFPWKPASIQTFWIDPTKASLAETSAQKVIFEGLPDTPFYAALYRTWDPAPDQDIIAVAIDHQFESYRSYRPHPWTASKIGGLEATPQWIDHSGHGEFFLQFCSIQPADRVPFPWINREEPLELNFSENGIYDKRNCLVLGDMGAISFCIKPDGKVRSAFECH